ncbi:MAG: hypothetical protein ABI467_17615 [Kofleriaceae bacterium]
MRWILAVLLAGCLGGGGGSTRPAVLPMLSELPSDPGQRDAILDQSQQTAGPEQRKGMTTRERKTETTAAYAAAILGSMFSSDQNVTLGVSTTGPVDARPSRREPNPDAGPGSGSANPAAIAPPAGELMPWVKLK